MGNEYCTCYAQVYPEIQPFGGESQKAHPALGITAVGWTPNLFYILFLCRDMLETSLTRIHAVGIKICMQKCEIDLVLALKSHKYNYPILRSEVYASSSKLTT